MEASLDRDHVFQARKGPVGPGLALWPSMLAVPTRRWVGGLLGRLYWEQKTWGVEKGPASSRHEGLVSC